LNAFSTRACFDHNHGEKLQQQPFPEEVGEKNDKGASTSLAEGDCQRQHVYSSLVVSSMMWYLYLHDEEYRIAYD